MIELLEKDEQMFNQKSSKGNQLKWKKIVYGLRRILQVMKD